MRSLHDMARRAHVPGVQYVEVREVNSPTPGIFLSTPHFEVMVEVEAGADSETVRANVARTVAARAREVGDGAVYDVRLFARFGQ